MTQCDLVTKDDEYILETTITNSTNQDIQLPEKLSPYALGVGLKSNKRPQGINPRDRYKESLLIDNMRCALILLNPNQSIKYSTKLSDVFDMPNGVYVVSCQLQLYHMAREVGFTSKKQSVGFVVQDRMSMVAPISQDFNFKFELSEEFLEHIVGFKIS